MPDLPAAWPRPGRPRLGPRAAYGIAPLLRPNPVYRRLAGWLERHPRGLRLFTRAEERSKEALFGCRMCGQCALPATGYACPMTCPKQLRNGPCGGVAANGDCEVFPGVTCVWVTAWERAEASGHGAALFAENPEEVRIGGANLRKQIENIRLHGVSPVVAINAFPGDHPSEHAAIAEVAASMGARAAVCTHFADGGAGTVDLARAVAEAAEESSSFAYLYPDSATLREKIETVATRVYGADGVDYDLSAARQLDAFERNGFGHLSVCIAKTHLSISSDAALKGAPTGWRLPVREVRASVVAGFIYPICGDMRTMPGLGAHPAAHTVDIDAEGNTINLS